MKDKLKSRIISLAQWERDILIYLYEVQDDLAIWGSDFLFPSDPILKERSKMVWRTIFKLESFGLIQTIRLKNRPNFIEEIVFLDVVSELLSEHKESPN